MKPLEVLWGMLKSQRAPVASELGSEGALRAEQSSGLGDVKELGGSNGVSLVGYPDVVARSAKQRKISS